MVVWTKKGEQIDDAKSIAKYNTKIHKNMEYLTNNMIQNNIYIETLKYKGTSIRDPFSKPSVKLMDIKE